MTQDAQKNHQQNLIDRSIPLWGVAQRGIN